MYDVKKVIEALDVKQPNAIPIFGGALWAYEYAKKGDIKTFVTYLPHVISEAKLRGWHEGVAGALRRFCHICFVDPMLIEAYLGIRFEELIK